MRALGCDVHKAEVKALIGDYSRDGTERVDFEAFQAIMTEKYAARDPEVEFKKAFALFDEENTGRITVRNLRRVARELGENIPEEELQAMVDEFGSEDGTVSEADFLAVMRSASE
jgi:Ca2+-binding EF-hand superfamily protein